jgi:EEF1A lysine methyltransferase 4
MSSGSCRAALLEAGSSVPLVGSSLYTKREYWDARFEEEEHHEWLGRWTDDGVRSVVEGELVKLLPPPPPTPSPDDDRRHGLRILVVGNGTSTLPVDMCRAGYRRVTATDYSEVVVAKMRGRYPPAEADTAASPAAAEARNATVSPADASGLVPPPVPGLSWEVADMTDLPYPPSSFDAVVEKAGMDALLADGGDTWDPPPRSLDVSRAVCASVARVLAPGGVFLQLSYSQPHFRRKHLLQRVGDGGGEGREAFQSAEGVGEEAAKDGPSRPAAPAAAVEEGDDEWEADLHPELTPSGVAAGGDDGAVVVGTAWASFDVVSAPGLGLGYFWYVMRVK